MLTKEQTDQIIEAAKADDAAEKLGALVGTMVQTAADAVVAEELKGIKANRDEFKADLEKFRPFGKPDEIQAAMDELRTLRAAKGKKPDPKELEELAKSMLEERVADFRAEQESLRKSIEEERDAATATSETLNAGILEAKRRAKLYDLAGQDVKPLMWEFFEKRLAPMLQPVQEENGEPWWTKTDDKIQWKVIDPVTKAPLVGKTGGMTPSELVESGRQGLGEKDWNSKEFAETFFKPKGKGGGAITADGIPTTPTGHVDPSAPAYKHFEALHGDS